jgi:predicted permease
MRHVSSLIFDVRSAIRSLRATPGFAAATVGILALGIGANTAIYSLVEPILFRRVAVADPDRLVRIYAVMDNFGLSNSSLPVFEDYRDASTSFSVLAAFADFIPLHMSVPGSGPERVTGALATGNYFEVLGVSPARGRFFGPADDSAANPVVVLSDRLWRNRFHGDPRVIGRTIRLNRRTFAVAGIAPAGFYGASLEALPDLWMPMSLAADADPEWGGSVHDRGLSFLDMVGRLKPGVSVRQAQAELDIFARRRAAGQPEDRKDPMPRLVALRDAVVNPGETANATRLSWILFGVVFLVLSITCADAAGLLLARGERRRREMAIRSALGASRARLTRQMLAESLLLSFAGAACGLVVGASLVDLVRTMAPVGFPIPVDAASSILDARVLLFSGLAATVTGAAFGLLPTLRAARRDAWSDLKGSTLRFGGGRLALRDAFSAAQIALCAILLVGAGLLVKTLAAERAVVLGFDPDDALVFSVDVSRQGYVPASQSAVFERLVDAVRRVPGVREAAVGRMVPIDTSGMIVTFDKSRNARVPNADFNPVGPGFWRVLGTRIIQGREFDERDTAGAPAVAVVNRTLAERQWPGQPVVGRVLHDVGPMRGTLTIVGVVDDARFRSLRDPVRPMISVPFVQVSRPASSILVRSAPGAEARSAESIPGIRAAVASVDPELPVFAVRSLRDRIGRSLGQERLLASLFAAFGALALLLAGTGLYGVVASSVETRRREFGIRIALGAQRNDVLRIVLRRGLLLACLGIALGIPTALAASRALSTVLFGVKTSDPATFAAAALVLAAVATFAGLVPARRASRVDPMESLRSE